MSPTGIEPPYGTAQRPQAHRDVQLAVRQSLADAWPDIMPQIAVVAPEGTPIVHVSTLRKLSYEARVDVRSAVHSALMPYVRGAPLVDVVFGTR